jgi:Domain of unknown function DUF488
MPVAFFTIGHSTRSIEEFVGSLQSVGVRFLVDVRTVPRSRRNPQFNREVLPAMLADVQIGYEHLAALGGLRGHKRDISLAVNAFWQNESFHNHAHYAMTEQFRAGLARLRHLGHQSPTAIMCAEAVWWQCHRRIIADYLIAADRADPIAWTAAIQTDLRETFGGVRHGKDYRPAYALVEVANKRVIIKINDVGPLKPGRPAARFFQPAFREQPSDNALRTRARAAAAPQPWRSAIAG